MQKASNTEINNSVCERCGRAFHCGVADEQPCWCATQFAPVPEPDPGSRCLCPDCLRARVAERTSPAT